VVDFTPRSISRSPSNAISIPLNKPTGPALSPTDFKRVRLLRKARLRKIQRERKILLEASKFTAEFISKLSHQVLQETLGAEISEVREPERQRINAMTEGQRGERMKDIALMVDHMRKEGGMSDENIAALLRIDLPKDLAHGKTVPAESSSKVKLTPATQLYIHDEGAQLGTSLEEITRDDTEELFIQPEEQHVDVQADNIFPKKPVTIEVNNSQARPLSYYAASTSAGYATGPPISASAYYQPAPSYPPPSPSSSYMRYAATSDYFTPTAVHNGRPLSSRFDSPITRTNSAFGIREVEVQQQQQIQDSYKDDYASAMEGSSRQRKTIRVHSSQTRIRASRDANAKAMPPPPAPSRRILRHRITEYDSVPEPPRESHIQYREEPAPRRASVNRRLSVYDYPEQVRVETANTGHRRQSYYGQSASGNSGSSVSSGYKDKLKETAGY